MLPLVTISIPLFKCEEFLEKCLLSVLNQTYKNLEVTLINDQTPDNSVEIAEKFITEHQLQNWKIYHLEENSGLSVVRNKGIDTAQGKYLFFLENDFLFHFLIAFVFLLVIHYSQYHSNLS